MDWNDIERIREPGFPLVRRGYDQRTVDNFLGGLADWLETDAAQDIGQMAVTRKLELVGKTTAHILLTTEQESEQMRRRTEEECRELRSEAEAAAGTTRQAADEYSRRVREKAEQDARRIETEASAKAKETIEEGARRRAEIEELVDELKARHDGALAELDSLRDELGATVEQYRPGSRAKGQTGTKGQAGPKGQPDAKDQTDAKGQAGAKEATPDGDQPAARRPRSGGRAASSTAPPAGRPG
jgi:cell division septum initiation protein DivIVA